MGSSDDQSFNFSDFRILHKLGMGGMGVVYLAEQISLGRKVALKVLGQALDSRDAELRFRREAQAAAKLGHPGIASIHYVGQENNVLFMALEYVEGLTLRDIIIRFGRPYASSSYEDILAAAKEKREYVEGPKRFDIETEQAHEVPTDIHEAPYEPPPVHAAVSEPAYIRRSLEIVEQLALALEYAHSNGVIHRDIKPENLMLTEHGNPKIIDFGLARFCEDNTLTMTGQLVGTPLYMSPEQVLGRVGIDYRTDIYSLGLVLYELLTHKPPIEAENRESLLRSIVIKDLKPIWLVNPSIKGDLAAVVHMACHRDAEKRYQSADAFASDVNNLLQGNPVDAPQYNPRLELEEILSNRPLTVHMASWCYGVVCIIVFLTSLLSLAGSINQIRESGLSLYWTGLSLSALVGSVLYGMLSIGTYNGIFAAYLLAIGLHFLLCFPPFLLADFGVAIVVDVVILTIGIGLIAENQSSRWFWRIRKEKQAFSRMLRQRDN